MRSLSRPALGVLLLATFAPLPGAASDAGHPLDPAAPIGLVPTRNIFEDAVPLLSRESALPSFLTGGEETANSPAEPPPMPAREPMDHGHMDHGHMDHGTPQAAVE